MMSSPPSDRDKSLPALRPVERPGSLTCSPSCFCGRECCILTSVPAESL